MIIYWSMLLWVPLIYFIYSLNHKEDVMLVDYNIRQGIQKKVPIAYAIIIFGYYIFWIGMRKYIADTTQYIYSFNAIPNDFSEAWGEIDWDGKSPGFEVFNVFFKCFISDNYTWWLMTIAIVCGVCVMITLRRYSCDFFFSSFLFISMLVFVWMMNGMRQFICVSILFAFCDLIKNKKSVKFILLVLLLSTIHSTVIIMIPIYFLATSKPWSKMTVLFIIGIVLICIFSEPFFKGVDTVLSGTEYAGEINRFNEDDGVNPLRVVFSAMFPIIAYWKRNILKDYYEKIPMLPVCINMSLATAALDLVGMFTSGILIGRMPIYCELFDLILIPYLLRLGFTKEEQSIVKPVLIIILVLFFYLLWNGNVYHSEMTGTVY